MYWPNLKCVAFPVPEIIGGTPPQKKKIGKSLDTPTLNFLQFFHALLFEWTLLLFGPNLKFVALPVPEIIAIGVLGGVANPNLEKYENLGGREWYRWKERWRLPIGPP